MSGATALFAGIAPVTIQYTLSDVFAATQGALTALEADQEEYKHVSADGNWAKAALDTYAENCRKALAIMEDWQAAHVTLLETDIPFADGQLTSRHPTETVVNQIVKGRLKPVPAV